MDRSKIRKLQNIMVRIAVVAAAYGILYHQLVRTGTLEDLVTLFVNQFYTAIQYYPLIIAIILMSLNWSIEAAKWQLLIKRSEQVSFLRSLKGVLTGLSVGTFTPNRWGEFIGRAFVLDRTPPLKVLFMTLIGSYSQLITTILFGTIGLFVFFLYRNLITTGWFYTDLLVSLLALSTATFVVLLYFNIDFIERRLSPWLFRKRPRWSEQLHVISEYSSQELFKILILSILRYCVFTVQFFLILKFFAVPISLPISAACTSVIYLIMAVVPTFALSEMGVRGAVSILIFNLWLSGLMPEDTLSIAIVSSSSVLWVINLVLPAILGTFFISHFKLFRNHKTSNS